MRFLPRAIERALESKIAARAFHGEPVDIASVVRAAVAASGPNIEAGSHQLLIHLPEERVRVHGNHARLAQAVTTLVNSAARYMKEHGLIEIRVEQTPTEVTIGIRDQGFGFPEEMLAQLFDPVPQTERYYAYRAFSIGLRLVKRAIELQGGFVTAHSRWRGSELVIHLPTLEAAKGRVAKRLVQHHPPNPAARGSSWVETT